MTQKDRHKPDSESSRPKVMPVFALYVPLFGRFLLAGQSSWAARIFGSDTGA